MFKTLPFFSVKDNLQLSSFIKFFLFFALAFCFIEVKGQGSVCPINIDFEGGNFQSWQCFKGTTSKGATSNIITVSPSAATNNIHTIIPKSASVDPYGKFPTAAPDGSGYSIRLGNDGTGAQAERVSYTFTVPTGTTDFVLTYEYAVVFQDGGHAPTEQPRFTAKVLDVAANTYIACSSFDYVATSNLPGFKQAPTGVSVFYKAWTPVTINLSAYKGKQIQLEFTTADCTLGGHFGYAYIDVDNVCSSIITGTDFCATGPATVLTGPKGYDQYTWYNADRSVKLGTGNPLVLTAAPDDGAVVYLDVVPFDGFGCPNTVSATLHKHFVDISITDPPDVCFPNKVDISLPGVTAGSNDITGLSYWKDSAATVPLLNYTAIADSGKYYVRAINSLGCFLVKPVSVKIHSKPVVIINDPAKVYTPSTIDLTAAAVTKGSTGGQTYSYYSDSTLTTKIDGPSKVSLSGKYYIKGETIYGCSDTASVNVTVALVPKILVPKAFTPAQVTNNRLYPFLLGVKELTAFVIYNRWGNIVFQTKDASPASGWDGIYKGNVMFLDTVTWTADGYDYVGNAVHRTGSTVIIK